MEWITTSTILDGLRDFENRPAWDQLVERFRDPIVRFVRTLGLSTVDAEDVAQETLLAFADSYRRGQFDRNRGRLSHWLFGIAFRQGLKGRRIAAGQAVPGLGSAAHDASWSQIPDEAPATASWERTWEQSLLHTCLAQVRQEVEPQTFQAFELVVLLERSAVDAAEELGVPVKAVYNAKHRVLKRIRELRAEYEELQ